MKIIQSFWSKPYLKTNEDETARFKGGWLNANFFLYSCLLSCLKFKEHYGNVELFTDNYGKKLLVDTLDLPYSEVNTSLESLQNYPSELWALGKILTYSLQNEPFLHADTDVFIWKKLPENFTNGELFAQNLELNFPKYKDVLDIIQHDFRNVPPVLFQKYQSTGIIEAFNAGVIGGQNTEFFKELSHLVFGLIDANLDQINKVSVGDFNMVFEQMLGMNLASEKGLEVKFLKNTMDAAFTEAMKFHIIPTKEYYIHTVGYAKKSLQVCEQIQARLAYEYPRQFEHLKRLISENQILEDSAFTISEQRKTFLNKTYHWLSNESWNKMIDTKFVLNKNCHFEELANEVLELHYTSPLNQAKEKILIEDWDFILCYFEKPTIIKKIVKELLLDESLSVNFTKEQLTEKVFSFVMDRCIYHEILKQNI
jgi:hypothetical protein